MLIFSKVFQSLTIFLLFCKKNVIILNRKNFTLLLPIENIVRLSFKFPLLRDFLLAKLDNVSIKIGIFKVQKTPLILSNRSFKRKRKLKKKKKGLQNGNKFYFNLCLQFWRMQKQLQL